MSLAATPAIASACLANPFPPHNMSTQYIKTAAIRKAIKAAGKRTSTEYLEALDRYVERAVQRAIAEHNGGKKTIDASVAGHTLGNK